MLPTADGGQNVTAEYAKALLVAKPLLVSRGKEGAVAHECQSEQMAKTEREVSNLHTQHTQAE